MQHDERKADAAVIEITQEMIEAGVSALGEVVVGEDLDAEVVRYVFLRMAETASCSCCMNNKAVSRVDVKH